MFSFVLPVLLAYLFFAPWSLPARKIIFHLRHYIEFQIQKNIFIPEMNDPNNQIDYKEWPLKKSFTSVMSTL